MFRMHITEILCSNREISFKIMTLYIKKNQMQDVSLKIY